jgi:phosphatidylglycerol:prolipoprotein diacylglycerol transferase
MDPTMIELGPLRIQWYGFFLTVAIFAAFEISKRFVKAWGYDPNHFEQTAFWAVIWGVIGARLGYVLTSPGEFIKHPEEIFYIWRGGLSFHGAIIGGLIPVIYYARRFKFPIYAYLDAMTPGVAMGIIAGRLGNIMNGSDTVGRLTNWPIGFTWPDSAKGFPGVCKGIGDISEWVRCSQADLVRGPVHFTQLYGVLIGLALLILGFFWIRQNRRYGYVFWQFVLWYSLLRGGLEETFRLNPLWLKAYLNETAGIGFFTATQIFSIPLIILGMVMLARLPKGQREPAPASLPVPAPVSAPKPSGKTKKGKQR